MSPLMLKGIVVVAIPAGMVLLFLVYMRYFRHRLVINSIKYSIDHLPMGLMFYAENGLVLLTNKTMNLLCESLTERPLMNGAAFHTGLFEKTFDNETRVRGTRDAFFLIQPERVIHVKREKVMINNTVVYQMTATETTDLYRNEEKLRDQMKELESAHERLLSFDESVSELARSEAFLATKVRIHDMLGQELLTTRFFLTDKDSDLTQEQVVERWSRVLEDLTSMGQGEGLTQVNAQKARANDALKALTDAATVMGLRLSFAGDFPEGSPQLIRIIMSCARVCMGNAVRHGSATQMVIRFEEKETAGGFYTIRFSNNGVIPPKDMPRGGGFNAIENLMREVDGEMSFLFEDWFTLVIRIPWV
ncbi:MAG: hypothetical protein IJR58_00555 [Lachnospiraceae bacterium]|nr:hypothetical protein [Lachnospiraceae bacterium]